MQFTKDHIITRKLGQLEAASRTESLAIPHWETRSAMYLGENQYTDIEESYSPFSVGDSWTCSDDFTRWFRTRVTIPEHFKGQTLILELDLGGEGIVRINGTIVSSITSYLAPSDSTRSRVFLPQELTESGVLAIEVEAHTNYMEFNRFRRQGATEITYLFRYANLSVLNTDVEDYYFDLLTAFEAMMVLRNPIEKVVKSPATLPREVTSFFESISKDDYYYSKVAQAVVSSISLVDFDLGYDTLVASLPAASKKLKEKIESIIFQSPSTVKFVGQAHIDTAWLWPIRETVRKCAKTLSNICSLMDLYPDLTFAFSQPQLFEYTKLYYPQVYQRVKEKVKTGQFEIIGNTWVEMDTNIPSGESLVRQILYGKQFFETEFGKSSDILWMPDVFGYSWALPQILKKSGMNYFFTSKLVNNDDNRFPHSLFQWQGIDGTKVTAYVQRLNYNGVLGPTALNRLYSRFDQKDIIDSSLMTFGYGDGGGGPTYQMAEKAKRLKEFPGFPKLELTTAQSFFDETDAVVEDMPVWNGEMYYEFHRGTYSSQANTKKNNRKNEILYRNAEFLSTLSHLETNASYPYDSLLAGYKLLLTNQFHDIIPGSSIHSVYVDADKDYATVKELGTAAYQTALTALTSKIQHAENTVLVFNHLSWPVTGTVNVSLAGSSFDGETLLTVTDQNGTELAAMVTDNTLEFIATEVVAMGYSSFTLASGKEKVDTPVTISPTQMENQYYKVTLTDNGFIQSIYDKENQREVLSKSSNLLKIFEDKPANETSWNIELEYQNKEWVLDQLVSIEVLEESDVKGVLRLERTFNNSRFVQDIILYNNLKQIVFKNYIDWQETEKMLKAEFHVDVLATNATYEIQFGAIERPTHWNTSYDKTRFEVCGHKWADLSEGDYGVSLLNDCKYGYDIKDKRMRITLLRAPIDPDPVADRGYHEFTYSLLPHKGSWAVADTVQQAYQLNIPLTGVLCTDTVEGTLPAQQSYFTVSQKNAVIDTVKCAENKEGIIVRLYECSGSKTPVSLSTVLPVSKVFGCNLMEENEKELPFVQGTLEFTMGPYEIKTFRFLPK